MRPQYHHIDAKRQLAKANSARGNESARHNEPRLIQQTARTAADGEEINIRQTSEYLTSASEEPWLRLRHNDEDVGRPIHWRACAHIESQPRRTMRTESRYSCPTLGLPRSSSPRGRMIGISMRLARKSRSQRRRRRPERRMRRNELPQGLRERLRLGQALRLGTDGGRMKEGTSSVY
jgi:hypothetical protein